MANNNMDADVKLFSGIMKRFFYELRQHTAAVEKRQLKVPVTFSIDMVENVKSTKSDALASFRPSASKRLSFDEVAADEVIPSTSSWDSNRRNSFDEIDEEELLVQNDDDLQAFLMLSQPRHHDFNDDANSLAGDIDDPWGSGLAPVDLERGEPLPEVDFYEPAVTEPPAVTVSSTSVSIPAVMIAKVLYDISRWPEFTTVRDIFEKNITESRIVQMTPKKSKGPQPKSSITPPKYHPDTSRRSARQLAKHAPEVKTDPPNKKAKYTLKARLNNPSEHRMMLVLSACWFYWLHPFTQDRFGLNPIDLNFFDVKPSLVFKSMRYDSDDKPTPVNIITEIEAVYQENEKRNPLEMMNLFAHCALFLFNNADSDPDDVEWYEVFSDRKMHLYENSLDLGYLPPGVSVADFVKSHPERAKEYMKTFCSYYAISRCGTSAQPMQMWFVEKLPRPPHTDISDEQVYLNYQNAISVYRYETEVDVFCAGPPSKIKVVLAFTMAMGLKLFMTRYSNADPKTRPKMVQLLDYVRNNMNLGVFHYAECFAKLHMLAIMYGHAEQTVPIVVQLKQGGELTDAEKENKIKRIIRESKLADTIEFVYYVLVKAQTATDNTNDSDVLEQFHTWAIHCLPQFLFF